MKVWRADGGWKCEACGAVSGRARRLSPTNSGGIGFVEVLMSESYWRKHLQCARRIGTVGSRWRWLQMVALCY